MVNTATRSLNLKTLEELLQQSLYGDPLRLAPLDVHCLLRDDTLMIVIEHNQPKIDHSRRVFQVLREMLEDEQISSEYQVLIYLRLYEEQKPYAFYTINSPSPVSNKQIAEEIPNFEEVYHEKEESKPNFEEIKPENPPEQPIIDPELWQSLQDDADFAFDRFSEEIGEYSAKMKAKPKNFWLKMSLVSILASFGLFYALTRPCVIGQCRVIPQATQLAKKSGEISQKMPSGKEILQAQANLDQSIKLLRTLPFWSPHRREANQLLQVYQDRSQNLAQIVESLKKAAQTSAMSQKPPFTAQKWQEIQQNWREVISGLEKVSPQSDFYSFAQEKLIVYRQNLTAINQSLRVEEQGYISLKIAQETAQTAQSRQNMAKTLEDWQLAYATWQMALNRLQEISKNSTAYEKAQPLIAEYTPKMAESRDRKNYELFADNAYNQGIRLAELARKAQTINQWSAAVSNWENSLSYLQQIPEKSYRYQQTQELIRGYTESLNKAENQLKNAIQEQQILKDLLEICTVTKPICTYRVEVDRIKVNLTSTYTQEIQSTAIQAKVQENVNTQLQLLDHISTLEKALQAISNKVGKRIDVYNADGLLLVTYEPQSN